MKLDKLYIVIVILLFIANSLFSQNTNPVVNNVEFITDGTTITVTYDVEDAEDDVFTVYMEVSLDAGVHWGFDYGEASGDIGEGVAEGVDKTITFTYEGIHAGTMKIRILANDLYGDQIYYSRKIYNTVTIGSQVWLKENLDVGTMITSDGTHTEQQQTNNGIIEKYCYDNDEANCDTYGGLYEWNEAMQYVTTESTQGICPSGWHIPSRDEWTVLKTLVGGTGATKLIDENAKDGYTYTNETGFSVLFAGHRQENDGVFYGLSDVGVFWTSTDYAIATTAVWMWLYYDEEYVSTNTMDKNFGHSIRCLKN